MFSLAQHMVLSFKIVVLNTHEMESKICFVVPTYFKCVALCLTTLMPVLWKCLPPVILSSENKNIMVCCCLRLHPEWKHACKDSQSFQFYLP